MTKVPAGFDNYEIRVMKVIVVPPGQPIFSEKATTIEIDDEAGGEYVSVKQDGGHGDARGVLIDPNEWRVLRTAIDWMVGQCRDEEATKGGAE